MEEQQESPAKPRGKWLKRIGCCAGIFLFVLVVLFAILVWRIYRQQKMPSPEVPIARNFTTASVPTPTSTTTAIAATDDDPSVGPKDARVTVVEFSDFECPFCRQAFPIVRELMVRYGDRVRFIYRDFPVTQVHDNAQKAAEAGACAHAQGKFWPMHDKIFQSIPAITVPDLKRYAREVGLDTMQFEKCLDEGQFSSEVQQDLADGVALGVRGTPTWFFNGRKVEGVISRETFIAIIEQLLTVQSK